MTINIADARDYIIMCDNLRLLQQVGLAESTDVQAVRDVAYRMQVHAQQTKNTR